MVLRRGIVASFAALAACSSQSGTLDSGPDATMMCLPGTCSHPGDDAGAAGEASPDVTTPGLDATSADANAGLDASNGDDSSVPDTGSFSDGPAPDSSSAGDGGCLPGMTCNVACSDGGTTTLSGKVFDPAGKNPLYNIAVYVPAAPLKPLPKGVPTGADACSCSALYTSGAMASAKTGVDGTFSLSNVPVGTSVPLVLQAGKWRRLVHVQVTACVDNPQPTGSLTMPGSVPAGDTDDNIPDIAVSTGYGDTLECSLLRMGFAASEYVAGAATTGHVHVFSGGASASSGKTVGLAEKPAMPGAPPSYTDLWASQAQLMPYDITLLSCEGGETYNANPPALEAYLNAGGRVLASHLHYAWFAGPLSSAQSYTAPSDWGANLASWVAGDTGCGTGIGGIIETTLNGSSTPFPKGVALQQWLQANSALTVASGELAIYNARFNGVVQSTNSASQPWVTADSVSCYPGDTMLFSFNAPVGSSAACGRAMFTEIHAHGTNLVNDTPPPPGGCASVDLWPQEKALEFALFDLAGCVVPDSATP